MKFKATKKDFIKYLSYSTKFSSNKNINTVLQNVLLKTEGNTLTIYSTNLMTSFEAQVHVEVIEEGEITVSSSKLYDLIKDTKEDTIITLSEKDSTLIIQYEKYEFKLFTIPAEQLPRVENIQYEHNFKFNNNFIKQIKKIQFCISDNPSKPEYTGAHFTINGDSFELNAADYQKIGITSIDMPVSESEDFTINIPKRTIAEISTIFENDEDIEISISKKQIMFKNKEITIYSNLIEKYIKTITKLFKDEYPTSILLNKTDFLDVLKNVSKMTNDITNGVIFEIKQEGYITLKGLQNDYGDGGKGELSILELTGEPITIAFNSSVISSIVNAIDTEKFYLKIQNFKMPVLVVPHNNENKYDYQYLLVPIIVDNYV